MGVHLMDKVMDDLCGKLQAKFQERWIDERMLDEMEIEVKRYFITCWKIKLIGYIPSFKIIVEEGEAPIIEIPDEDLHRMIFQGLEPSMTPKEESK